MCAKIAQAVSSSTDIAESVEFSPAIAYDVGESILDWLTKGLGEEVGKRVATLIADEIDEQTSDLAWRLTHAVVTLDEQQGYVHLNALSIALGRSRKNRVA